MQSSFWLKFLFVFFFAVSATPGKNPFQYKKINLKHSITCSTFDDPSDLDPLNDQQFKIHPSIEVKSPIINIFSIIEDNMFYNPNMSCNLDKKSLTYTCKENEYRSFSLNLKNQWHAQGSSGKLRVHFLGHWKRNPLMQKPQRIFCHQDLGTN